MINKSFKIAPRIRGTRLLEPFWPKMVAQGPISGSPKNPKSLQKRTFENRRALGPSENLMKNRYGNGFRNHQQSYTLASEAGKSRPESEIWMPQPGKRIKNGGLGWETGARKPETGAKKPETGHTKAGNRRRGRHSAPSPGGPRAQYINRILLLNVYSFIYLATLAFGC